MITFSTSQIQNVDLSHGSSIRHDDARANPRLRSQLVHRSSLLKADTYAAAPRSCPATSSTNALMGVGGHQPVRLPRANPHSARGTTACHFPRFRSLKAFGRRPRCTPRRRDRPASETLNIRDRVQPAAGQPMSAMPPIATKNGEPLKAMKGQWQYRFPQIVAALTTLPIALVARPPIIL